MRVSVLTYDVPHRKTYDTLCLLKAKGYEDVKVLAHSMTYKKIHRPVYAHRPESGYLVPETEVVCRFFGYGYERIDDYRADALGDVALVCGAGIIPQEVVSSSRLVNSHPGYIPLARGLDALKWEVLEGLPIGVTTHFLGDEVDAGEVIERRVLDFVKGESFFELGMRVYANEIDMLVGSLEKLDEEHDCFSGEGEVHRRMPADLEREMMRRYRRIVGLE